MLGANAVEEFKAAATSRLSRTPSTFAAKRGNHAPRPQVSRCRSSRGSILVSIDFGTVCFRSDVEKYYFLFAFCNFKLCLAYQSPHTGGQCKGLIL
jgi:hypothetical protein